MPHHEAVGCDILVPMRWMVVLSFLPAATPSVAASGCFSDDCADTFTCPPASSSNGGGDDGAGANDEGGTGPGGRDGAGSFVLAAPSGARVVRNATADIVVTITRDGFDEKVELSFSDLPSGVTANPATIGTDDNDVTVTLSAASDAALGPATVTIADPDGQSSVAVALMVADPPGAFDETFGTDGVVALEPLVTGFDEYTSPRLVIEAPDGDIIMVGDGDNTKFVARFDRNAVPRTTFNDSAAAAMTATPSGGSLEGVAYDAAAGKVVVSGFAGVNSDGIVMRFNDDGSPDTGFGSTGFVTVVGDQLGKLAVQADSKIVVASGDNMYRFDTDGTLDTSFANSGIYADSSGGNATQILLEPNGSLIAAGRQSNEFFYAYRLSDQGLRDMDYGFNGTASIRSFDDDIRVEDAVLTEGSVVIGGYQTVSVGKGEAARFTPSGTAEWITTKEFQLGTTDRIYGVAAQADGKVLFSGHFNSTQSGASGMYVLRVDAQGELDPTFGVGGVAHLHTVDGSRAADVEVIADGRILALIWGNDDGPSIVRMWD